LYLFEEFALDTDRRELRRAGDVVQVEPQVFDLLQYLIRHRENVVSKDDLLAGVWGGRIVSDSALNTRINAARSAIGDTGAEQRLIRTSPRKGIRFVGTVREEVRESEAAPELSVQQTPSALPLPDRPSIAVLPFANMSGDPEQEYFADGMAEEIITALSRCSWLFVVARNSSFTYKGRSVDVRQIGQELGVRYVIEGSVRRSNDRLRFTGQLIDASTGAHIWADRFDGQVGEVFDLQDRFTESIVAAIEPRLELAEIERLKHRPAANLDAYDLLLRAQALEYEFTRESLEAALKFLKEALAIDPSFAPAMALAAYCHAERRNQGWALDLDAEAAEGLALVSRAVERGRENANVMWMAAYAVWRLAQDAQRAREFAYLSLQLNPNSAIALAIAAWTEASLANTAKAFELCRRAERLSPRDPRGWMIATSSGIAHFIEGSYGEAAVCFQKALVHNPRFTIALRDLAASYAMLGDTAKAAAVIQELLKIEPGLTLSKVRARTRLYDEGPSKAFAEGLRIAGLPE
jgi:TolB-like protein